MLLFEQLRIGDEIPALRKGPITRQLLVEWCAAENDYYPLHYDERVSKEMKLPGTPIQGTYKYALMAQAVQRWLGIAGVLNRLSARYRAVDLEGECLTARGRITQIEAERVTLEVWVEAQSGTRNTEGVAVVTFAAAGAYK
ncbi:MAG: MaoC/PaaZ C-terminal domain-containing protein [Pseudomonadota bacterium]|nr:MaoC/PaaZ C-terminal domain-containing protein [Pseudomonadota bacterium]